MTLSAVAALGALLAIAQSTPPAIDDAQIAAVVVTANQVDIDAGKLAATAAASDQVKQFAELMVLDHTGVNKNAVELATKLRVTPKDNPTSLSLKRPWPG